MESLKRWFRPGRSKIRASRNLGIIVKDIDKADKAFRNPKLETLDAYYERRQYKGLAEWAEEVDASDQAIPLRKKKPLFNLALSKTLCARVASKLIGEDVFPEPTIPESPDDEEFFKAVVEQAQLKSRLIEPVRRMLNAGSVFVRFYIQEGQYKIKWYHAKYCYPTWQGNGELELMTIMYTYDDHEDVDTNGKPRKKWYRIDLGMEEEILFDNPLFEEDKEPQFVPLRTVEHGLGFVQGEFFKTAEMPDSDDGYSLVEDILEFVDELNYSLSQSSKATSYNQDPQLVLKKLTEDEMDRLLVRSSSKSWNMGREGEAQFLETNLSGVERATELRDKVKNHIVDITRVILLEPEKIVGSAQSAKAMEVLHGPLVDLVKELRPVFGAHYKKLVLKISLATLIAQRQGLDIPIMIPPGYSLQSFNLDLMWPEIFQQTIQDLRDKVGVVTSATSNNIISRATGRRFFQQDFKIDDLEAEGVAVDTQTNLNPFGGF